MRDLFEHYRPAAEYEAEAELRRLVRQVDASARQAAARVARGVPNAAARRMTPAGSPALPGPPLTARDLIDTRIDVAAQRVLLQLASTPRASALARGFLDAVRGGRLAGIYKQDQRAPALLARQMNLGWWQLIPKGEHAVLVLNPSNMTSAPPLVAFSTAAANSPALLAPALGKAWETFNLWFSGRAKFCPVATPGTTAADQSFVSPPLVSIVPRRFCGPPDPPRDRTDAAVDTLRSVVNNGNLLSGGQFYMSKLFDAALKDGRQSFNRPPLPGAAIFNHLWNKYATTEKPATAAELRAILNEDKFELTAEQRENLREHELDRCFEVTGKVTRLILRKNKWPGPKTRAKGRVSFSRSNLCRSGANVPGRGFVINYVNTLAQRVAQVKAALDDGHLIEAGVVSGIEPDSRDPLGRPEHFILVIGYEGDKFVFWDPDATASRSTRFGTGFGFLFFDRAANRFTTAAKDDEMPVGISGIQENGQHRYQIITLQARPGAP